MQYFYNSTSSANAYGFVVVFYVPETASVWYVFGRVDGYSSSYDLKQCTEYKSNYIGYWFFIPSHKSVTLAIAFVDLGHKICYTEKAVSPHM